VEQTEEPYYWEAQQEQAAQVQVETAVLQQTLQVETAQPIQVVAGAGEISLYQVAAEQAAAVGQEL
jgi:hypothetical protein